MRYVFNLQGLTCKNCVATVKDLLSASYKDVDVTLLPPRVYIASDAGLVTIDDINLLLKETKYRALDDSLFQRVYGKIKLFLPFLCIIAIVTIFAYIHARIFGFNLFNFGHYFMAGYFLIFGMLKIVNWPKFVQSYKSYDTLASRFPKYAQIYPGIEFSLGVLMYFWIGFVTVNILVTLLMLQKAHAVFLKLRSGEAVRCACLGGFFNIPVTWITFFEDFLMALMAIWMIIEFS